MSARWINVEILHAQRHAKQVYLDVAPPDARDPQMVRIVRARTKQGRTEVLALGSGEWLEVASLGHIHVR